MLDNGHVFLSVSMFLFLISLLLFTISLQVLDSSSYPPRISRLAEKCEFAFCQRRNNKQTTWLSSNISDLCQVLLPHTDELELHHNMLSSCSQKVIIVLESFKSLYSSFQFTVFLLNVEHDRCERVLAKPASKQSSSTTAFLLAVAGRQK